MKVAIVSASSLGLNCWSALRFTGSCHKCDAYDRCKYPERVANKEYDELRSEAARLRKQSEALYAQAKEMK